MTLAVVIDASFAASLLLEEEHSAFSSRALRETQGAPRLATGLLPWEMANILRTKRRRGVLTADQCKGVFEAFLALEIALEGPPGSAVVGPLGDLADQYALSAYDAGYLELALRPGNRLATLDDALAKAGVAAGLAVLSPFA